MHCQCPSIFVYSLFVVFLIDICYIMPSLTKTFKKLFASKVPKRQTIPNDPSLVKFDDNMMKIAQQKIVQARKKYEAKPQKSQTRQNASNPHYIKTTEIPLNNNSNNNNNNTNNNRSQVSQLSTVSQASNGRRIGPQIANLIDLNGQNTYVPQSNRYATKTPPTESLLGGGEHVKYNGRTYVLHKGPKGGRFIVVKGNKVYV
jgi:hypothetical protein